MFESAAFFPPKDNTDPFTFTKTKAIQFNTVTLSDILQSQMILTINQQHSEVTGDKADQMLFKCQPSVVPGSHKQRQMITLMASYFFKHVSSPLDHTLPRITLKRDSL